MLPTLPRLSSPASRELVGKGGHPSTGKHKAGCLPDLGYRQKHDLKHPALTQVSFLVGINTLLFRTQNLISNFYVPDYLHHLLLG